MRFLNLQLRFLLPLLVTLIVGAVLVFSFMDRLTLRWFYRDLGMRGTLLASALSDSIGDALKSGNDARLQLLFERTVKDERLVAIGLCLPGDRAGRQSAAFPRDLSCAQARQAASTESHSWKTPSGPVHVGVYPVNADTGHVADVVLLHELAFVERRTGDARRQLLLFVFGLGIAVALITMIVAQLSWQHWIRGVRGVLHQDALGTTDRHAAEFTPIVADLRQRLRDLEDEYRRAQGLQSTWTAERLRTLLKTQLNGDEIIVVSNREPCIHEHTDSGITMRRPASGLVTALEPVMRACSGTWIAHGSGDADREVTDRHDRFLVPAGQPEYALRRIWLSAEEERGYYNGLANEGLWPLCHMAHVRPVFRETDWDAYRAVNERFADAVIAEARSDNPVVLVQDYHFALLPAMIRERLPRATIISFWHIPWPNPESFGICPWRREILQGMLGSTIIGFQTRHHSKNFMETVDRFLEARIEHEHSTVSYHETTSFIESYPISIAWPSTPANAVQETPASRRAVFERLALREDRHLLLGVDRFDYTKGIIERLLALRYLFEHQPQWIGRLHFVQVAAPTRGALAEYQRLREHVQGLVDEINSRFGNASYQPVCLLDTHHDQDSIREFYRAADVCLVTSLHDGMNLVCKEFIAARDDERGVLILSRFAGAARELPEAMIVNPYHVEEVAAAILRALEMPPAEQRERMISMRQTVHEFNVFRWAGQMLSDAGRWRLRERVEARVLRHQEA